MEFIHTIILEALTEI